MQLETIQMGKEEAVAKWKEYVAAEKVNKSKEIRELKALYRQLAEGKKVLDIFQAFKKCPLNELGEPRLAIASMGAAFCNLEKRSSGAAVFSAITPGQRQKWQNRAWNIEFPEGTFANWPVSQPDKYGWTSILRREVRAPMPLVPPKYVRADAGTAKNGYYVLWEVEKWEPVAPKDPALLRRMTANLFIVVARWNLTKLERVFIGGKLT